MKRTPKPFVVERKRRAGSITGGTPSIWSSADGRAFRDLAEDPGQDAKTSIGDDQVLTRAVSQSSVAEPSLIKPRILQANSSTPPIGAPISGWSPQFGSERPAKSTKRDRKQSVVAPADRPPPLAEAYSSQDTVQNPSHPVQSIEVATTNREQDRRTKRVAARKKLPLHERWKWDLPG